MRILGPPRQGIDRDLGTLQPPAGVWGPEATEEWGIQLVVRLKGSSFFKSSEQPETLLTPKTSFCVNVQSLPAVWSRGLACRLAGSSGEGGSGDSRGDGNDGGKDNGDGSG